MMDLRPFYYNALEYDAGLFAGVEPDQLSTPSPCEDWDVRTLMNHMVSGIHMFANALHGKKPDASKIGKPPEVIGDDPAAAFEKAREKAIQIWGEDGALDRTVTITAGEMPATMALRIALTEAIVHGWDLAKATGQKHGIDPMIAAAMLDGLRKAITSDAREPFFGPEVRIADDAPIEEQLVAFLGREP